MEIGLFARGLVLGFAIAAAVGPISLLTIRRTLTHGLRAAPSPTMARASR